MRVDPGPRWTFLARRLSANPGGQVSGALEELPLHDVRCGLRLSAPGEFSAKLDLRGVPASRRAALEEVTGPGYSTILPLRDGTPVGEWIVWGRNRSDIAGGVLELTGQSLESWLWMIPLPPVVIDFKKADQLRVACDLIYYAQAGWGGNGVAVKIPGRDDGSEQPLSNRYVDRSYRFGDGKPIGEMVADLAASTVDGFDWAIDLELDDAGHYARWFHPAYPRRGRDSGMVLDYLDDGTGNYAGTIRSYAQAEDGTKIATQVIMFGQGEGDSKIFQQVDNPDMLAVYPPLVPTYTESSITTKQVAREWAEVYAALGRSPLIPPTIAVAADSVLGEAICGDDIRVEIDPMPTYPTGVSQQWRLLGMTWSPTGGGDETVDLTVGPVH